MAKTESKYKIHFGKFKETIQKNPVPNNLLIAINEKILFDEILDLICKKFIGNNFDRKNNLSIYNADDKIIDNMINQCSNTGLFSDRKTVVIRNVKKLLKHEKLSLIDYLQRPNPDTCLIMECPAEEFTPGKVFLYETKSHDENSSGYRQIIEKNVSIYEINTFTSGELLDWVREKFGDYKIDEPVIKHFLQFTNYSLDEIITEIEKLKTYTLNEKIITADIVNLCNGIAKDFNENDFIRAVIEKNYEKAIEIYDRISLKKDVEVFLVFLLSSSFMAINKLYDSETRSMNEWDLKRALKIWFPDQDKLIPLYKNFRDSHEKQIVIQILNDIYTSDRLLKTSGGNKKTIMCELINNISGE